MDQLFIKLIQSRIKGKDLSIREAARQIGIAHTTLIRCLDGLSVDLDTLFSICDWLGVSPSTAINTFQKNSDATNEKITLLIQFFPDLMEPLENILHMIEAEQVQPSIFEDILTYIEFRLMQYKRITEKEQ